jgi:hypothetical protein
MSVVCNRCGFCCYYVHNGVFKKCKHLVLLKSGKSLNQLLQQKEKRRLVVLKITES